MNNQFGAAWFEVLDHLEEAVIVLDDQRVLRHVNSAARRLLGYDAGQEMGGRCRLTTRGVDCENSCPLTFALESGLERVEDFSTVYRTGDDQPLALRVTVIPLRDAQGRFLGAAEILRPTEPDPGFFMAGRSAASAELRQQALALVRSRADVLVVGEVLACRSVARAIHRFSGVPEHLFLDWSGSWDGVDLWPPGTAFADGAAGDSLMASERPEGWRIILSAREEGTVEVPLEVIRLPPIETLDGDLPLMIARWVEELASGTSVSPAALERLTRVVRDRGFEPVEEMMKTVLASAGDRIEESDLELDGYGTALVDELLQASDPLSALEERLLSEILDRCGWRIQEAADRLGISRVTLWRKMKELRIDRP
ncbi:MAG: helix-turn-helix domain-containing protein [Thermoanaerobaculales bacterium]